VNRSRIGSRGEPEIPGGLVKLELGPGDLIDDASWTEVVIHDGQLIAAQAQRLELLESRLVKVDFSEGRLPAIRAVDVDFADCNLANVRTSDSSFRRVAFSHCKLTGFQASKTAFSDVTFRKCRMDLTMFAGVRFKNVTFDECVLREADFSDTSFDHVRFAGCDLGRSLFVRTHAQRSELRQCTLTELRGLSQLRGMAMEWSDILGNAEVFAAELGIEIITGSAG